MPDFQSIARQKAKKYGIDPNIFTRQIKAESGFNPNARSPAGAQGIAQIMPATAKGWGVNPSDPVASLDAAARNMATYVKKYGSYKNALVAYNAGPGRVGRTLPAETQNYIKTILGGGTSSVRIPGKLNTERAPYVKVTPGQDNSSMRQSLLLNYIENRNKPDALLGLATGLSQAQDSPSRYRVGEHVTRTRDASVGVPKGSYGKPVKGLQPQVIKALAFARAHGWKGQVNSGYRSDAEQVRIWNSGVRPAAKPKALGGPGSNHSQGTAVDVSDVEGFARAMQKAPKSIRLYNNVPGDALHFSVNGH